MSFFQVLLQKELSTHSFFIIQITFSKQLLFIKNCYFLCCTSLPLSTTVFFQSLTLFRLSHFCSLFSAKTTVMTSLFLFLKSPDQNHQHSLTFTCISWSSPNTHFCFFPHSHSYAQHKALLLYVINFFYRIPSTPWPARTSVTEYRRWITTSTMAAWSSRLRHIPSALPKFTTGQRKQKPLQRFPFFSVSISSSTTKKRTRKLNEARINRKNGD